MGDPENVDGNENNSGQWNAKEFINVAYQEFPGLNLTSTKLNQLRNTLSWKSKGDIENKINQV